MSRLAPVLVALVVLLASVGYLHHEVLFGGQVYHMDDAADGYYPSHVAIGRAYAAGELPVWERTAWAGFPLIADPYYGAFYPPNLAFVALGAVRGLGWSVALHTVVAGLAMFWLLRRRALSVESALFGAVAYALSSFMVERIRHVIFPQMMAWLPLILAGVEGWLRTRRARELLLTAGATGLALISGALPLLPFVALVLGGYVAGRVWDTRARGRSPVVVVGALAAAAGVGVLLAAAQLVPTLAHLPSSPRQLGTDYAFASSYAWPDLRYLGVLLAPDAFGGRDGARWMGAFNRWEMAGWYVGLATVCLAPLARMGRRRELVALGAVAVLGLLLAFGDRGLVHRLLFRYMPLYSSLRCPTRALVMLLVAVPILGAEGLEALWASTGRRGAGRGGVIAIGVAALVLLGAGAALWLGVGSGIGGSAPAATAARRAIAHVLVVGGGLAAVIAVARAGLCRARVAAALVVALSLADLLYVGRGQVQPRPADYVEGTERFAAIDWLLDRLEHDRQASPAGLSDRFVTHGNGPFRLLNVGMTYDAESASGYDSYSIWRYVNYLYVANTGAPYPHPVLKDDLAAGAWKRLDGPLVDLANIRWAVSFASPGPGWIERFAFEPGTPLHAAHEPGWDPRLKVYENPRALPRAFVVHRAIVRADPRAQAEALATLDPRTTVILDGPPGVALPAQDTAPELETARVLRAGRTSMTVETGSAAPGVLVVSEAMYPGWSATLDGQPTRLHYADYAFRGVAVPAGRHLVELSYRSRPVEAGLALSALGLLGLGGLGLALRRRGPRTDADLGAD